MYAMMQCKVKSENLAHILRYQIWAVTPWLPTLDSRVRLEKLFSLGFLPEFFHDIFQ